MSDVPQTIEALLEQICRPDVESLEGQLHIDIKGYAKDQLKSLFETMMAEVVGDTPIPSEDDIWRYTDEGVGKFILLKEQRQRIPQVLSKYFDGGRE